MIISIVIIKAAIRPRDPMTSSHSANTRDPINKTMSCANAVTLRVDPTTVDYNARRHMVCVSSGWGSGNGRVNAMI
jgi:hypothetical protein